MICLCWTPAWQKQVAAPLYFQRKADQRKNSVRTNIAVLAPLLKRLRVTAPGFDTPDASSSSTA
ncbi:MAG: hypothetical protein ACYSSN_09165, partial [Planctomycetota bacterium]